MTARELTTAYQRWRDRIEAILTPDQLALYDTYHQRLMRAPVVPTPDEQAVLDVIEADQQATVLDRQLEILLRVQTPPQ
jgi:hypothetical protein